MERARLVLSMAARNLLRNRGRTASTLIAITVGLLGLTLLDGFVTFSMNGFRDAIVKSGTGHLQVARSAAYFDAGDTNPIPFLLARPEAIISDLRAVPAVSDVMPTMSFSAALSVSGSTSFVRVTAVPVRQAAADLGPRTITSGNDLAPGETGLVLVGTGLSRKLGLEPGRTLSVFALSAGGGLNTESFTVSGTTSSGIAEVDDISVTMSLPDAQGLVGVQTVPDLVVFLRDIHAADAVARRIASAPAGSPIAGLTARTWQQLSPAFQQANSLYQLILGVARLIVLVVALFSISGTLSVSVIERYRELGTLRAFGTRRRQVLVMLAVEGLILGAAGAVLGLLFGSGASGLINVLGGIRMPPEPGMSTAGITVRFTPQAADLVGNAAWLLLASVTAALVPALVSQRRPAAELLRSK